LQRPTLGDRASIEDGERSTLSNDAGSGANGKEQKVGVEHVEGVCEDYENECDFQRKDFRKCKWGICVGSTNEFTINECGEIGLL